MVITLIGYRGCGKSSVAPLVARSLGWEWFDSDQLIEQQAGCSIRQIFETEGEAGFRRRESQIVEQLLGQSNLVLAAGGGAVLAEVNRRLMRAAGPVVWLQATAETLARRISEDNSSAQRRPSLTGKSVCEEIADVLTMRTPVYQEAATHIIDADQQTPDQIADTVLKAVSAELVRETRQ